MRQGCAKVAPRRDLYIALVSSALVQRGTPVLLYDVVWQGNWL